MRTGVTKRLVPALVAGAMGVTGLGVSVASAGVFQAAVVSTTPAPNTPNLLPDGVNASGQTIKGEATYALEQSPDAQTMYVGGLFVGVESSDRMIRYPRSNFMAFSISSGAVLPLAPSFNGPIWAIRASADGTSLYVAGEFTTVNGLTGHRGIVKIDATSGAIDPKFKQPWASGKAYDLQVVGNRVIVGGTFAGALLALDPATGANLHYFDTVSVSGTCVNNVKCGTQNTPTTAEPTHVYRFAVSNDGTHLVAIGNFDAPHPRAFMVDLGTSAGTLDAWYYQPLANRCYLPKVYPAYLRDVGFAPDGQHFEIAATGYVVADATGINRDVCDAVARFPTAHNPVTADAPNWINYTGGDTLHSVVDTGSVVYVNGHNRWLDNPNGKDSCLTTCVPRPGIGAIDPGTGRALTWNPTKTRGVGGKDLLSTSSGVWVGSDGAYFNNKYHYGLAFVPLP